MKYELLLSTDGQLSLTLDGEVMWDSQEDEEFTEEFGEAVVSGDVEDAAAWLVEEGYIPPRVPVDFVDESIDPGEDSGWFKTLGGDDEESDQDDEPADDDEEDEE